MAAITSVWRISGLREMPVERDDALKRYMSDYEIPQRAAGRKWNNLFWISRRVRAWATAR
ncbi:hypothetical protein KCP69_11600 [Salmonella enterica subsp. enterica]|nr:hypothetical protein KCP69_11600 [Salmonella enterica subsp. enterica]